MFIGIIIDKFTDSFTALNQLILVQTVVFDLEIMKLDVVSIELFASSDYLTTISILFNVISSLSAASHTLLR